MEEREKNIGRDMGRERKDRERQTDRNQRERER